MSKHIPKAPSWPLTWHRLAYDEVLFVSRSTVHVLIGSVEVLIPIAFIRGNQAPVRNSGAGEIEIWSAWSGWRDVRVSERKHTRKGNEREED